MINTRENKYQNVEKTPAPEASLSCDGIDVWPCIDDLHHGIPNELDLDAAKIFLSRSFDQAVLSFLKTLGQSQGADRAWCVEYSQDLSCFRDTYEWCVSGVATYNVDNLDIPSTALGMMHDFMKKGHPVSIYDVSVMPRTMRALQTKLDLQKTLSSIGIPLFFEGKLRGIIGLDMTHTHIRWKGDTVQQLCRLSELFSLARFSDCSPSPHKDKVPTITHDSYIYFQGTRTIIGANQDDLAGCCAEKDNTRFFLKNGQDILDSRSLKWWENVLPESHFMRVHRSTILKLNGVREIKRRHTGQWVAYIKGHDAPLNVSRDKVAILRNRLGVN